MGKAWDGIRLLYIAASRFGGVSRSDTGGLGTRARTTAEGMVGSVRVARPR